MSEAITNRDCRFLNTRGVTQCPAVCAVPTQATVAEADRAAYRDYIAAQEAARVEKLKSLSRSFTSRHCHPCKFLLLRCRLAFRARDDPKRTCRHAREQI